MATVLALHGPNLNLLGERETQYYGTHSLESINSNLAKKAKQLGLTFQHFQSNSESALIERLHQAKDKADFILFNPAAFTHTSVALRDALLGVAIPFIEIHLSNTLKREEFRHHSYFSDIAVGCIIGLGPLGYELALQAADFYLKQQHTQSKRKQ